MGITMLFSCTPCLALLDDIIQHEKYHVANYNTWDSVAYLLHHICHMSILVGLAWFVVEVQETM